jgi:phosphoribulokinase
MFILKDLRDQVFGSYQSLRYLRTKGNKAIAKQMDRNPKFGFFSNDANDVRWGQL